VRTHNYTVCFYTYMIYCTRMYSSVCVYTH
jgi:hypothetical protein